MNIPENQAPSKLFKPGDTVPDGWPCDPWHAAGNSDIHAKNWFEEFKALCQEKLTYKTLPIYVGCTGYVEKRESFAQDEQAWSLDDLGRLVVVYDNIFLFQRYANGGVIRYKDLQNPKLGWRDMSTAVFQKLAESLKSL